MAHFRGGRLDVELWPAALNLPRCIVIVDGALAVVSMSYGNGSSDPVFRLDIDLSGTRAGRCAAAVYWWTRSVIKQ